MKFKPLQSFALFLFVLWLAGSPVRFPIGKRHCEITSIPHNSPLLHTKPMLNHRIPGFGSSPRMLIASFRTGFIWPRYALFHRFKLYSPGRRFASGRDGTKGWLLYARNQNRSLPSSRSAQSGCRKHHLTRTTHTKQRGTADVALYLNRRLWPFLLHLIN